MSVKIYDQGWKIRIGLVFFVLLITSPILYNHLDVGAVPQPEKPKQGKQCVLPAEEMRAKHMQLLQQWRNDALRNEDRAYSIAIEGKKYQKSLMNTCMNCHDSKQRFCDRCHSYTSVSVYCWDCHIAPEEMK